MASIKEIKNKKGISYKVSIRHDGYKPIYKTFYDKNPKVAKKEAKLWADDIELQIRKGTYKQNILALDDSMFEIETMEELINYFETNIAPIRYSYSEKYCVMYAWWKTQIGKIKVRELSAPILSSCRQILASEKIKRGKKEIVRGNNTINKYLMCISAVLTYAVRELEIIDINPMFKVKTMEKPSGRTRFLSSDEITKLALACKKHSERTFLFFLILLSTGGRYAEVLHLSVENIDFKNSRVLFLNTKNKTNRGVGINADLLNMIKQYIDRNNITSGYIFINKKTNKLFYMRGILQNIIKQENIENFHIHDLRHTFASIAAQNEASLLDIATILGHKSLVMARRYSHLTQQHADEIAKQTAASMPINNII